MQAMTNTAAHDNTMDALAQDIERELTERHGLVLDTRALCRVLGYPSAAALRQAWHRGTLQIPLFEIPRRRGRFALTREVARWLAQCRHGAFVAQKGAPML